MFGRRTDQLIKQLQEEILCLRIERRALIDAILGIRGIAAPDYLRHVEQPAPSIVPSSENSQEPPPVAVTGRPRSINRVLQWMTNESRRQAEIKRQAMRKAAGVANERKEGA